eukprot:CAMPEP_0198288364 /NCGR_PEP_ID=MMETSP1449-20131203/6880_1 /TAXON_ID=420275 /ORGANISM="Attheya septentrionalis, Strain CCMP2084" /LENGTH=440 /DNA_ID=CAMNT_0043986481 /DNA_START=59 /DNA_END=1381 /DNA_ORIENTATION=+
MMGGGGTAMMGPHADVLGASPSSPEEAERLVHELKERAKGAMKAKAFPDAERLYQKAIQVSTNPKEKAILESNVSLAHFHMLKYDTSLTHARTATELDPTYLKGHWRMGQALMQLKRYADAMEVYSNILATFEENNKAVQKELDKATVLHQQEQLLLLQDNFDDMDTDTDTNTATPPLPTTKPNTNKPTTESTSTNVPQKTTTTSTSDETVVTTKNATGEFSKSDHVKGYKVVNGKKTSYFHHEMTEKEKKLIGDIAPKRLEPSVQQTSSELIPEEDADAMNNKKDTSAWNKAGTWEERNVSAWANDTLTQALKEVTFEFPKGSPAPPGSVVRVTRVKHVSEGHASVATVRSKKRYMYEFHVSIEWELKLGSETCRGSMVFPDIDGTVELGDGYDMTDFITTEGPPDAKPLLERFVKNDGFRTNVHAAIDEWVRLFQSTY